MKRLIFCLIGSILLVFHTFAQTGATDGSRPISEVEKAKYRAADKSGNDKWVTQIQDAFIETMPPYHNDSNKGHYFAKDYHLWDVGDLGRIDKRILGLMHDMAEIDDDAHLIQIMPDYFKGNNNGDSHRPGGGIVRFKHCIEAAYYGNEKGWYGVK